MKSVILTKAKPIIGATLTGYRFNNGTFESVTTSCVVAVKWQPQINSWLIATQSGSIYFVVVNLP